MAQNSDPTSALLAPIETLKIFPWFKAIYDLILLRRLRTQREHKLLLRLSPQKAFLFEEEPWLQKLNVSTEHFCLLNSTYLLQGSGRKSPKIDIYFCNTEETPIIVQAVGILPVQGAIQYGIGGDPPDSSKPTKTAKQIEITEIHSISMVNISKTCTPAADFDDDQLQHISYPTPPKAKPFKKPLTLATGDSIGIRLKLIDYALAMPQHFVFKVCVYTDRSTIESQPIYFMMQDIINPAIYGA